MLVTRVLGDCPDCKGTNSYGNVSVHGNQLLRGCQRCKYTTTRLLPEIRKKVIYLDQFFFSHAFRAKDQRFVSAVERVKRMTHLQLLISPYSSVHEDETRQWRGYKDQSHEQLMEFIKATSRGVEFEKAYSVEETQVLKAFEAFLAGGPPEYVLETRDAIRGALDEWDDYFWIDVGGYSPDIELKRTLKTQAVEDLVNIFDQWQHSTQTFDEDVAVEMRDAGRIYLQQYLEKTKRLAEGDFSAILNSPIRAMVVEHMLHYLPKDMPRQEAIDRCVDFFQSEHFAQVPHEWISARIFATLKGMVKRGAYANREEARKRLSGVFDDISHISVYAPYCDAFVMDTPMAEVVRQPSVGLEQRYGVRVFSLNNWDELLEWLNNLEAGMTERHKVGIAAVYPDTAPPAG